MDEKALQHKILEKNRFIIFYLIVFIHIMPFYFLNRDISRRDGLRIEYNQIKYDLGLCKGTRQVDVLRIATARLMVIHNLLITIYKYLLPEDLIDLYLEHGRFTAKGRGII